MPGAGSPDHSKFPWFDTDDEIESRFRRVFGREMTPEERRVFLVRLSQPKRPDRDKSSGNQGPSE